VRISTTTIESYRLFMEPDQEWMTEDDLIATITGEFVPTPAVLLGHAYGRVLEDPPTYRVSGGYRCGNYCFSDPDIDPALALIDRRGVFEVKAVKTYPTVAGPVDVSAVADHLYGGHLSEFKTTKTFSIEKYLASCQWRFYADIFEPLAITYHVFTLDDHGNGVATLRATDSFRVYPYAGLHADCCELLDGFVHYVTAKGLDDVLRERQREAADDAAQRAHARHHRSSGALGAH
jgi:hypothetical protein